MNLKNYNRAKQEVRENTPIVIIELLASQIGIAEEARDRISTEGIVVRDMTGSVIAHPAIKIEQNSLKIISDIVKKYKKR